VSMVPNGRLLRFGADSHDRWATLCKFLGTEYPPFPYPADEDIGLREPMREASVQHTAITTDLRFDKSPWVVGRRRANWQGIAVKAASIPSEVQSAVSWVSGEDVNNDEWKLRDDTFPSNLCLFRPENFLDVPGEHSSLVFRDEPTLVREYTSAAMASNNSYRYGTFKAQLRASGVSGTVTGVFLHRNSPRQEIDIEILGKNSTRMLVNVFYNPGPDGTNLEYGYRGTPTMIDLGFDAAADFHVYEIDWKPNVIQWKVDGAVVYERVNWDPTPIPDQPMEFNVNLWHSRSKDFAGRLTADRIPTSTDLRTVEIRATMAVNHRHHAQLHRYTSPQLDVV